MEPLAFLSEDQVRAIQSEFGTPVFVYDAASLEQQANAALAFPNPYGLTVRYAMKALPTAAIVRRLHDHGLEIDASSGYEARRAMRAGVPADRIELTAQELPADFAELIDAGVSLSASSLGQLRTFGERFPGGKLGVRINPGLGSGHNNRTNVGGPSSSFGIWRDHIPEVLEIQERFNLHITRVHTHIGSGGDPQVWMKCAELSLSAAASFPEIETINLGGGFKVARMDGEVSADLEEIGAVVSAQLERFAEAHGKKLQLEIEPGTYIVANAGALIAGVMDVVDTGPEGYAFIKVDAGMTDVLRPAIYGAQHPIALVAADAKARSPKDYLVVGHCCESGDVLTPEPGNPEGLNPRTLVEAAPGDALVVGGAGAYCSAMSCKNYNSFPEAAEVLVEKDGAFRLIRKRQTLDQILANEVLD